MDRQPWDKDNKAMVRMNISWSTNIKRELKVVFQKKMSMRLI